MRSSICLYETNVVHDFTAAMFLNRLHNHDVANSCNFPHISYTVPIFVFANFGKDVMIYTLTSLTVDCF